MVKLKKNKRLKGFSLLELLAVMAVMAMLSTIAVTGYFSAVRGMARRSAVKHLVNTLVLARQRACLDGVRVSVMLFNDLAGRDNSGRSVIIPSYVVCKEIGTVSGVSGNQIWDEFETLDKFFNVGGRTTTSTTANDNISTRIYNMTAGGWWEVEPRVKEEYGYVSRQSAYHLAGGNAPKQYFDIPVFVFTKNTQITSRRGSHNEPLGGWLVGHTYGIEAAAVNSLPRGFLFDKFQERDNVAPVCITFNPDGSAENAQSIKLIEKNPPQRSISITVKQTDGTISYSEKWT